MGAPQPTTRPTPPLDLVHWSGAETGDEFYTAGANFVSNLNQLCSLQPSDSILDVGCGAGSVALPLQELLNESGSYIGFDVHKPAVDWCSANIGADDPRFVFHYFDLYSGHYNPTGSIEPAVWSWPFEKGQFDVVCFSSVFTHVLPPTTRRYIHEMRRVLRVAGKFLASFFLVPPGEEGTARCSALGIQLEALPTEFAVMATDIRAWVANRSAPEAAVAYRDSVVLEFLHGMGFEFAVLRGGQDYVWGTKRTL